MFWSFSFRTDLHDRFWVLSMCALLGCSNGEGNSMQGVGGVADRGITNVSREGETGSDAGESNEAASDVAAVGNALNCENVARRMRECDLLSEGDFDCTGHLEPCVMLCELRASCESLAEWTCNGYSGTSDIGLCIVRCEVEEGGFICPDTGEPRTPDVLCDGVVDCPSGADEEDCPFFVCREDWRTKIPRERVCDLVDDCTTGSDEIPCDDFVCGDGSTVAFGDRCDEFLDCDDESDEVDCPEFLCGSGEALPIAWKCNGFSDCEDFSDETDCAAPIEHCQGRLTGAFCELFECDDGSHVSASDVCNTDENCPDGSDEPSDCQYTECEDGTLLPESFQCDGVDDCVSGVDEQGCPGLSYSCSNGDEIGSWSWCNGLRDCNDWSDEINCCDEPPCATFQQCSSDEE